MTWIELILMSAKQILTLNFFLDFVFMEDALTIIFLATLKRHISDDIDTDILLQCPRVAREAHVKDKKNGMKVQTRENFDIEYVKF